MVCRHGSVPHENCHSGSGSFWGLRQTHQTWQTRCSKSRCLCAMFFGCSRGQKGNVWGLVLNFGISQKCSVYSLLRNCEMFFFYPSCALYDLEFRVNLSTSLDAHVLFNISIIFQLFVYSTTTYYIFGIIGKYHIQLFLLSIKKKKTIGF